MGLFALAAASGAADTDDAAARSAALAAQIEALALRIESDLGRRDEARTALESVEKDITRLLAERDALALKIGEVARRIGELDRARTEADRELPALTDALADALRAKHRLSRRPRASIVLELEDPAAVQRILTWFDHLLEAQNRRVEELVSRIGQMRGLGAELDGERERLEVLRADFDERVAALVTARGNRRTEIARIGERVADSRERIEAAAAERERLERLLEGIEAIERAPPAVEDEEPAGPVPPMRGLAELKGSLHLPTAGAVSTRFDEPDPLSGIASRGIVIDAPEGAEVRAISAGQVVYADWFRGYGLLLVIDHGDGFMSLYGYNSRLLQPIGAFVEAGAPVALAGSTGGRSGAGVYFEIRRGAVAVDPLVWCAPRSA